MIPKPALLLLVLALAACGQKDDTTVTPDHSGSIETSISVEHADSTHDVVLTTHKVWTNGLLSGTIVHRDTIPGLGLLNTVGENGSGDTATLTVPKDYQIFLITAALASCHHSQPEWRAGNRLYIRGDSTAPYTRMTNPHPGVPFIFYRFRPYGYYFFNVYHRVGYYSDAFSEEVNIGHSDVKSGIVRGGFGESAFSVES